LSCDNPFTGTGWDCPKCGYSPQELNGFVSFAPRLSKTTENYDANRYAAIAAVEREHFWFRGRNDVIAWALGKFYPDAQSLMEIGCGTGQVLGHIRTKRPGLRLVGTEIHTQGLKYSRETLPESELLQMDASELPFAEEFDVICAFDVIEHIDGDAQVLAQMLQACRPGGGIIITVPQHRWLWSSRDDFAHHKRRYRRRELEEKVKDAGFKVITTTSFVSILLPLMYMSRLWERVSDKFNPQRELSVHPLLNKVFLSLMRCESALIRLGISLPIGGSLLLVAKKREPADTSI